jgi:hypothetical protein
MTLNTIVKIFFIDFLLLPFVLAEDLGRDHLLRAKLRKETEAEKLPFRYLLNHSDCGSPYH